MKLTDYMGRQPSGVGIVIAPSLPGSYDDTQFRQDLGVLKINPIGKLKLMPPVGQYILQRGEKIYVRKGPNGSLRPYQISKDHTGMVGEIPDQFETWKLKDPQASYEYELGTVLTNEMETTPILARAGKVGKDLLRKKLKLVALMKVRSTQSGAELTLTKKLVNQVQSLLSTLLNKGKTTYTHVMMLEESTAVGGSVQVIRGK